MSDLAKRNTTIGAVEKAVLKNDLQALTEIERIQYYLFACRQLNLNPATRPFDYLVQDGKMSLYLNAVGVAQLRALYGISTKVKERSKDEEFIYCTAVAYDKSGRQEEATAVLSLCDRFGKPVTGQSKANLIMKAETKAKRRATLALRGIPWGDSGEIVASASADPPLDLLPAELDDF